MWRHDEDKTACHLNQAGFARNLVETYNMHQRKPTPGATPYRSGLPIDSIASADKDDESPSFVKRRDACRSLVGSIGWLACCTRPDLAPVHSFLASYNHCPARGHMDAALYALHYIHSTHDYGISFTSKEKRPVHTFIHYPHKSDVEAYGENAVPPKSAEDFERLSTYADACWGSQIGNAVAQGTPLELFKFRSMSGAVVLRMSGPVTWLGDRQQETSLSTCEAEIKATNAASKATVATRNFSAGFERGGVFLGDTDGATKVYNDNEACIKWCHNMTSKSTNHMELWENFTREWVQDKILNVLHVPGAVNISDIFTKEIRDKGLFRRLRDLFMCRLGMFARMAAAAA